MTDSINRACLLAAVLTAGFAVPALALPQPMREGNATYISGGIGADETQALKADAGSYDLRVTNADKTGHFVADTNFEITSKNGRERINVSDTGPLFYAQLPPGQYVVRASNGEQQAVRDIKVSAGKPMNMELVWKDQG